MSTLQTAMIIPTPTGRAIMMPHIYNCILPLALMRIVVMMYVQCSLHTVHVHYNNGPRRANLSSRPRNMLS